MKKYNITEIRLENAREAVENAKITESVELFQSTFFTYAKLEKQLEHYHEKIKEKKNRK